MKCMPNTEFLTIGGGKVGLDCVWTQRPLVTIIVGSGQIHQPSLQMDPPVHSSLSLQDPPGGDRSFSSAKTIKINKSTWKRVILLGGKQC